MPLPLHPPGWRSKLGLGLVQVLGLVLGLVVEVEVEVVAAAAAAAVQLRSRQRVVPNALPKIALIMTVEGGLGGSLTSGKPLRARLSKRLLEASRLSHIVQVCVEHAHHTCQVRP